VESAAAKRSPAGTELQKAIEVAWETTRTQYAQAISDRLGNIEEKVKEAVGSNTGIYGMVSADLAYLSSILGRTPRDTRYISRPRSENKAAGDDGEIRAGIDPTQSKRQITIIDSNGDKQTSFPDRVDDTNMQVTEVKNVNNLTDDPKVLQQIKTQAQWAQENGYTHTLIVDHRTRVTDPDIQRMIDNGQIELIRMELDDGPKP